MRFTRIALATLILALAGSGCSGGGGSSSTPPTDVWPKFRHDNANSGQAVGAIDKNDGNLKSVQIDETGPFPISASASIDVNGTLYVGSEGGTLAAITPSGLSLKWRVSTCDLAPTTQDHSCPHGAAGLGSLISSPTVYTLSPNTSVFVGSAAGAVFGFNSASGAAPTCTICFLPAPSDFGSNVVSIAAAFLASPAITTDPVTLTVNGIFIGARVDVTDTNDATRTVGKVYAINHDGSVKWVFPAPGLPDIPPVTSTIALSSGNTLIVLTDGGVLYALNFDGSLKWSFPIGGIGANESLFAPSPVTGTGIFVGTARGDVVALNNDGTFRYQVSAPTPGAEPFVGSLGLGAQLAFETPTPTVKPPPTPTPQFTPQPTPTTVPFLTNQVIFGVTRDGQIVLLDAALGTPQPVYGTFPAIDGQVLSSPVFSGDLFLVFATSTGKLYAINSANGAAASVLPEVVQIPSGAAIRSSPTIDANGVIYFGADDGLFYAVGAK